MAGLSPHANYWKGLDLGGLERLSIKKGLVVGTLTRGAKIRGCCHGYYKPQRYGCENLPVVLFE